MHAKFGRRLRQKEVYGFVFSTDFEVESYLKYQGKTFIQRFDANSYLYITKAMDYFDLTNGKKTLTEAFREIQARFSSSASAPIGFFPSYQSKEIVTAPALNGVDVSYCEISSRHGHDAFLLEHEQQTIMIKNFLAYTMQKAVASGDR